MNVPVRQSSHQKMKTSLIASSQNYFIAVYCAHRTEYHKSFIFCLFVFIFILDFSLKILFCIEKNLIGATELLFSEDEKPSLKRLLRLSA